MTRVTFLVLFLLTLSISGNLSSTFGTTAFKKPSTTKAPLICPSNTKLVDGKCVLQTTICEKGKTWSSVENKCICPEKDTEYNKDLLQCTKGGVWTPTFDKKIPANAFTFSSLTPSMKLYPVKIREGGSLVIGKLNSEYGIVNFDDEAVHIGSKYDEIFTTTELKFEGNSTSKVSGNYLTFRVKGKHEVSVKLISQKQCFSISIGVFTNFIGIQKCLEPFTSTVYFEDPLNNIESRGFWIYWNSSSILMGMEEDLKPRIQLKDNKIEPFISIKYFSKGNVEWQVPVF